MADESISEQKSIQEGARPKPPRDLRTAGLLALIVVLGVFLRLWGIGWSLPDARHPRATYHPDERINMEVARQGKLDIGFYNYGTLYFYGTSLAQTIGQGYGAIPAISGLPPGKATIEQQAAENAGLFLAGRLLTALLGTATIWVLFALGSRMFGKATGLLAALLYAIAPLAVVHAHFLTVDVPATFFVSLALLWSARLLTMPTWREYALAGVWVGLAAATKYNVGLVLAAPIAAHFLNLAPGMCRQHRGAQLVVLIAITLLTFLIACPGPILNLDAFWNGLGETFPGSGVRYELFEHSRMGHGDLFTNTGPGWWYHLVVSLRFGLGVPLLLAALVGIGIAFQRRTPADKILLAFFLLYYLATGFSAVQFARYMIPLFPVLCLLAARLFTDEGLAWFKPMARRVAATLVALLTLGYSGSLVHAMAARDPRDATADYLEQNAPQGASIAFGKIPWFYSPPLSPRFGEPSAPARARAATETRFQLRMPASEWDRGILQPSPDYIVLSNIETMHPRRLHEEAETQFEQALPSDYRQVPFAPPSIFDMSFGGSLVPEDLLYILPRLTVYQKQ